jgi:hypothetical protein
MPTTPFEDWLDRVATLFDALALSLDETGASVSQSNQASNTFQIGTENYLAELVNCDASGNEKGYRKVRNNLRKAVAECLFRRFDVQLLVDQSLLSTKFPLTNPIPNLEIQNGITVMPVGAPSISWSDSPGRTIDKDQIGVEVRGVVDLQQFQIQIPFGLALDYAVQVSGDQISLRLARGPRIFGVGETPLNPGIRRSLQHEISAMPISEFEKSVRLPITIPNPASNSQLSAIGNSLLGTAFGVFYVAHGRPFARVAPEAAVDNVVNATVMIHKTVFDERIVSTVNQQLDSIRAGLDADTSLSASIDSISFEAGSQSIAVILSAEFKSKKKFELEIPLPYGGVPIGSVTMRVSKSRTMLIRATPIVASGAMVLEIKQDGVVDDGDTKISFSPDIVDILTTPMKEFAGALVDLFVALNSDLSQTVPVIDAVPEVTVNSVRVAVDRIVLSVH